MMFYSLIFIPLQCSLTTLILSLYKNAILFIYSDVERLVSLSIKFHSRETRAKHKKAAIVDKRLLIVFPENPMAY